MLRVVTRDAAADPTPVLVAAVAGHVIAPGDLVGRHTTVGALRDTWIHVVHYDACFSTYLTGCLVHRVTTLEASLEATGANGSTLAAASRPPYSVFTAGTSAPFQLI